MKKRISYLFAILFLIIGLMIYVSSCGDLGSACEDLLHRACECLYSDNPTKRETCHSEIDKEVNESPFTAEQDSQCQQYIDSCTCDAMKSNNKSACGDVLDTL